FSRFSWALIVAQFTQKMKPSATCGGLQNSREEGGKPEGKAEGRQSGKEPMTGLFPLSLPCFFASIFPLPSLRPLMHSLQRVAFRRPLCYNKAWSRRAPPPPGRRARERRRRHGSGHGENIPRIRADPA